MSTIRIYQTDQYANVNEATVTGVKEKNGLDIIACSQSVFFPEGGGQPSDTGTVSSEHGLFEVTYAFDEGLDSDVWHLTDAPSGTFSPGDSVILSIDFDRRFRNMQRHLGEHMLSGAIDSLFGGVNKGFHMGEEYITIDIDLGGRMLTAEELDLAERSVNEAIWADLPVTVSWFDDYESSLAFPVRKAVYHEGRVSVVTVGDPDDPFDCIACCGTHPARSSEAGLLAIYKHEPNKGMDRIYFDCGSMAKEKLAADSRMLSDIAKSRSCSPSDLADRLRHEADEVSEMKARLSELAEYAKKSEFGKIQANITDSGSTSYVYSSDIFTTDELLKLGFSVINADPGLFLIMEHPAEKTCLLFSSDDDIKCGSLVKEYAPGHGGRGGGRPESARAVFPSVSDMDKFIDEIRK